ncbi:hypothetical protein [Jannaschia seohaensis]|uniref:Uncharacterized protein n=1 Tax=Jannaschia seohaensis TaxID=475081 RepID=A0A2Y9C8Q1_9RHOB|nr:hypothetical protein [Jannaschia seohaensis]PWJ15024.1 hypothetical protein BCF38_11141 [Jannaschia seohaensis]SSA49873.1 hypothetical protein SAMN05421539_11141 [Jannaschia seohaensis]
MPASTARARRPRLPTRLIWPAAGCAAALIAAIFWFQTAATDHPFSGATDPAAAPPAAPESLRASFDALCAETACDADALTRLVQSTAAAMTPDELDAALAAQDALIERLSRRQAAATRDPSALLSLQLAAETQIAETYRAARFARQPGA